MDLKQIAVYVLAGYGAYAVYEKYVANFWLPKSNGGFGYNPIEPQSQADCVVNTEFIRMFGSKNKCQALNIRVRKNGL